MEYESHYFASAILMVLLLSLTPQFLYGAGVIDNKEPPEPWQGRIAGVNYSATSYDWETVTIEYALDDALTRTMEINARNGKPETIPPEISEDVKALLDLGANYVDIGFNTVRMAAEIPFAHINVDKVVAEKVVEHLINIRNKIE